MTTVISGLPGIWDHRSIQLAMRCRRFIITFLILYISLLTVCREWVDWIFLNHRLMLMILFIHFRKTWVALLIQVRMMLILLWKEPSREVFLQATGSLARVEAAMIFMNFKMRQYISI